MARVLADNGGMVPASLEPSVSGHISACLEFGLLQRRRSSARTRDADGWALEYVESLIPTRAGWERLAEVAESWPYDENARAALGLRTRGWSGPA
jgi:hypothetical protein